MTWETFSNFLLPFGGWSVIVVGVSGYISKMVADRVIESKKSSLNQETEMLIGELAKELERLKTILGRETDTYRLKLKKQEILFEKEIAATREFMRLHQSIRPRTLHPDMDWDEACTEVAKDFGKVESIWRTYIIEHGFVLDEVTRRDIEEWTVTASNYKFDAHSDEPQLTYEARKKAGWLLERMPQVEGRLVGHLRG